MTRIASAAAFLLLIAVSSRADIFRWVDETGTIHFTDDASNIPAAFRGKSSIAIHEPPKSAEPAPIPPPQAGKEASTPASPSNEAATTYGEPENTDTSVERLKSKIAAKEEFLKYVEDRQNLALNPDRRRVLNPGDLELYNKYKEELPKDRDRLRELEPPTE